MRRCIVAAACLLAAGVALGATVPEVVARVNGEEITKDEFVDALVSSGAAGQVLEQLVLEKVVRQYAEKEGIEFPQERYDRALAEFMMRFPSEEAMYDILRQRHTSIESVKRQLRTQALLEEMAARDVTISDEEIAEYFEKNKRYLRAPEKWRVRLIQMDDKEKAEELKDRLRAGEIDFAEAAKQYSIHPSAQNGGDIGFVDENTEWLHKTLRARMSILGPGIVSDVVEIPQGYFIFLIEEKVSEGEPTLENTRDKIEAILRDNAIQAGAWALRSRLVKEARIEKFLEEPGTKPPAQSAGPAGPAAPGGQTPPPPPPGG